MMMSQASKKGTKNPNAFTFVELLLVITLIAILATVTFPRLNDSARETRLIEGAELMAEYLRNAGEEASRRGLKIEMIVANDDASFYFRIQDPENAYQDSFLPFGDSLWDSPPSLPPTIKVRSVQGGPEDEESKRLLILPGALETPYVIKLLDAQERVASVTYGSAPGEVLIEYDERGLSNAEAP